MNIARYKEVENIFVEVVDFPANQRRVRIDELTDDPQLIELVEQLLREHDRLPADDFLESSLLGTISESNPTEEDVPNPATIKGYSIVRVLGRGTSGTVYLAKSSFPLDRLVALKLIHIGSGKNSLARFQEEQRILAQLKHPGIAEVFDEGISEGGRPFTVLEYIESQPITEYCQSHDLDWREIVKLLIQCCDAVAHAHQRNIIHRDLKPSNLLVSEIDGIPRVKVIDFGTAKLLDPALLMTQLTTDSQFVGTLPYSSPEQLTGSDTPDTRTDVHALGIVLYECLEHKHPFFDSGVGLKQAIDLVMTKEIPEVMPKSGLPVRELNAILSQSCAKDPADRYSSLMHFSEDLQNLLHELPVHAMKARRAYIARKFIRRHRGLLSVSAVIFALFAIMAGIAVDKGIQANTHRNALRETAIGMVDDLMPMLADLSGSSEARRELASSLHERINDLLLTGPTDRELLLRKAYVLEYESDMHLVDGFTDQSGLLRSQAAQIINRLIETNIGPNDVLSRDQRRLLIKLGDIAKDRQEYDSARDYYQQAHELLLAAPGDHREGLCWSFERLSWIAGKQKRTEDHRHLAQQRMNLSLELLKEHPDSISLMRNCAIAHSKMAQIYLSDGMYDQSLQHAKDSMALSKRVVELGPDLYTSQETELHAAVTLVRALYFAGQLEEANTQSDLARHLAIQLVEQNPGRINVRDIAWRKLRIVHETSRLNAPLQDRRAIEDTMRALLPDRPFD